MKPRIPLPVELTSGPFTTAQGRASGLGLHRMRGADLARPFHGIRGQVGSAQSAYELCSAYALKMKSEQFFSHQTAARIWRVPLPRNFESGEAIDVATLAPGRAPRGRGVRGRQLADSASVRVVERFGFAVADPATTWCQLASVLDLDDLIAAGDHLVLTPRFGDTRDPRPYVPLEELRTRVQTARGAGSRLDRRAVAQVRDGAESRPESLLRLAIVRALLPEPELNVDIHDARGRFIGRADMVFWRYRVIVEYDGDQHRTDTEQYDRDITRIDDFIAAGWTVVRVRSRGVFADAAAGVGRVEAALRRAGWRPGVHA
jgi:very-short-patch-repair endonuclease